MFCRHCGNQVSETDQFCNKCGGAVSDSIPGRPKVQQANQAKQAPTQQSNGFLIAVIVVLVCLVAFGIGYVVFSSPDNDAESVVVTSAASAVVATSEPVVEEEAPADTAQDVAVEEATEAAAEVEAEVEAEAEAEAEVAETPTCVIYNGDVTFTVTEVTSNSLTIKVVNDSSDTVQLFGLPTLLLTDGSSAELDPFDNMQAYVGDVLSGSFKEYTFICDTATVKEVRGELFSMNVSVKDKSYTLALS